LVKVKGKILKIFITLMLCLVSLTFIYPLYFMLINSLKIKKDYYLSKFNLPPNGRWAFSNFVTIFTQFKILDLFRNTLFIVICSTAVIIVLGIFASFAISKLKFKGSSVIYLVIIATIFLPAQVTIIPMYVMYSKLNLINNPLSVILCYIASFLPQTILLMVSFFRGIPNELIEESKIDGCNLFQEIWNVVIPIGFPAIIINIIFNFLYMWNDLFVPMIFLQRTEVRTVMVALATLVQRYAGDPTFQLTGLLVSTIPAFLVYMCLQRYIVKGITVGAIK
jgi:ABC-type glycerol-3-phosphate transport system permease component